MERCPLSAEGVHVVQLTLRFEKQDERTGKVRFMGNNWIPSTVPFVAEKAHWVGGRYGVYAVGREQGDVMFSIEPQS